MKGVGFVVRCRTDGEVQIDCQLLMAVVLGLSERCLLCAV